MITLKLKKVYFTTHDLDNIYEYVDEHGKTIRITGSGILGECEDQTFDQLSENEAVLINVDNIPFITFRIDLLSVGYRLISTSPISLKTYTEQALKFEHWGDYESVGTCVDKCISILAGFINRMGKEELNDGNYYKD